MTEYPKNILIKLYGIDCWTYNFTWHTNEKLILAIPHTLKHIHISERNINIFTEYYSEDTTYENIAQKYKISRQRVEQIISSIEYKLKTTLCYALLCASISSNCNDDYVSGFKAGYNQCADDKTNRMYKGISIDELDLSTRTKNILKRNDIHNTETIIKLGKKRLYNLYKFGPKTYAEICKAIDKVEEKLK